MSSSHGSVEELYGLRVDSTLALAGRPVDAAAHLTIRVGELRPCPPPASDPGIEIGGLKIAGRAITTIVQLDGGGWSIRFEGLAEARLAADLRTIVLHADPTGPSDMLEVLAGGPVLALYLALGGVACLHASAVVMSGAATAFVGASGAGKSTLAGLCCSLGADLVADDILRLDLNRLAPLCIPGGRELRLRPGAARLAEALAHRPQRTTADGRTAVLVGPASMDPVPLRAVLVPVLGAAATGVRRLHGADALATFLGATRVGVLRLEAVSTDALEVAATLAARVPVWEIRLTGHAKSPTSLPRELTDLVGLTS